MTNRTRWLWAFILIGVLSGAVVYRWAFAEASWPVELENPRTDTLFTSTTQPTESDLELLTELVTTIALADPIMLGLLDGRPLPEPAVRPLFWTETAENVRSVLIGGVFDLNVEGLEYEGPWPSTGCDGGKYSGQTNLVRASGLGTVSVTVDLVFERVTQLEAGPPIVGPDAPTPSFETLRKLETAPWYTGSCPRVTALQ